MADQGFNLRDLVTKRNATLNIPPFAKGKQLSTKACTKTRRIPSLRIHACRESHSENEKVQIIARGHPHKYYCSG